MGTNRAGHPIQPQAEVRLAGIGGDCLSLMKQLGLSKVELYRAWVTYLRCCEKGGADDMKAVVGMMRSAPELSRGVMEYFAVIGLNLFFDSLRETEREGK